MNLHTNAADAAQPDPPRPDENGHEETGPFATNELQYDQSNIQEQPDKDGPAATEPEYLVSNEPSRTNAVEPGLSRPDANGHDHTRLNAPDRDETTSDAVGRAEPTPDVPVMDGDSIEHPEPNWLDVEQAAELLKQRGISRTIRTIQKMCKREDLIAKLVPTENGVRYIISDLSIDDFIKRHNEKLPSGGFGSKPIGDEMDAVQSQADEHAQTSETTTVADPTPSQTEVHMREVIELKDHHIIMLQSQLETSNAQNRVKDEQIATMHERDHETNVLIQNLQNLVALPPGRSNASQNSINLEH